MLTCVEIKGSEHLIVPSDFYSPACSVILSSSPASLSLKTGGLRIGGVGIYKVHLVGDVYDLKDVADFSGIYLAAEAGITLGIRAQHRSA